MLRIVNPQHLHRLQVNAVKEFNTVPYKTFTVHWHTLVSMIKYFFYSLLFPLLWPCAAKADGIAKISIYAIPGIYQPSQTFKLQTAGITIPVIEYNPKYDYAHFSMSKGSAVFTITLPLGTVINNYNISPEKLDVPASIKGNQLQFSLSKDEYLIIKINALKELVIAADAEEQDVPSASGKGIFNVSNKKYNADRSGVTLTTPALQQAINDASAYHNGIVYIPAGVYNIGNLNLKSNMSMYLEGGAVLYFGGSVKDYRVNARKISQNRNITWWLYTDSGSHDIKIYGRGTLDGNGKYSTKVNNLGNHILAIFQTQRFLLDGLIIRDSGAWGIIPTRSKDITFKNFKIFNRLDMGENDGMDVIESENVLVKHGIGIALDDPFSTKTWDQNTDLCRNWPGSPQPQHHIIFDDLLSWTYCYAFKIGQGVMQPQTDISFKNCVCYDAAVAIGIHHKWGTAYVNEVKFDHIDVEQLTHQNDDHRTWCVLYMQNGDKKGSGPISHVKISNIKIYDSGKSPGKIRGVSTETEISDVVFKNITMPGSTKPAKTLEQMNIRDTLNCRNVKVLY